MSTKTSVVDVQISGTDYIDEARSIQKAAQAGRSRVVKLGPVVFFSTLTGDAWLLDPEEGAATCVAQDREVLAIPIRESHTDFTIEWQADYRIEGRAFIVKDRNGGSSRTILGYPVEEIEKVLHDAAANLGVAAAQKRLKAGRNEPCPCGSGRKYKKCCRSVDEELARRVVAAPQKPASTGVRTLSSPSVPEQATAPSASRAAPRPVSESERRLDELWAWFDSLQQPSVAQMDELLEGLLALPHEATEWNDVMHTLARKGHPDLPAVFRRIDTNVPHTQETGISYFYWEAAEQFTHRGPSALLPEVTACFIKLDEHSYDLDVLAHLEDILLANRFEAEVLALAERFLPIVRSDGNVMPHAVTEMNNLIFLLRAGMALRGGLEAEISPQAVAQTLWSNLEDNFDDEAINCAVQVVCETNDSAWTRSSFDLVMVDTHKSGQGKQDLLRLHGALMRVAREAWRIDGVPPGWALIGLSRLLGSVSRARNQGPAKRKSGKKGRKEPRAGNLLDYLNPTGLERRIVQACPEVIGLNVPQVRILLDAHLLLLDFAGRHRLIEDSVAAATRTELMRLHAVIAPAANE